MPENITKIEGATQIDLYLGNYSYANIVAGMAALRIKLATDKNQLAFKNAAGTTFVIANESQIDGTQYRIPDWGTATSLRDGPMITNAAQEYVWLDSDNRELRLGAASNDYGIKWDGTNAVHTIAAGNFVFARGNVGIGTDIPGYLLEAAGNTSVGNKALVAGYTNEIWSQPQTNAAATLLINHRGYLDAQTQFRN